MLADGEAFTTLPDQAAGTRVAAFPWISRPPRSMGTRFFRHLRGTRGGAPERALAASREFWEAKAHENAYWYVSSFGAYQGRDPAEFWSSGQRLWHDLKTTLAYAPSRGDTVVEIGCGVGRLTRAIAPEVGHVHAFDLSPQMLSIAGAYPFPNVTFHLGDGQSLRPLRDQCARLVLAYCVFQHLPSEHVLATYLGEMTRVAEPAGILAFTLTPRTWRNHLAPLLRVKRWLKERLLPDGPRGLYRSEWLGIRPRDQTVRALSPVALSRTLLHGDKWLFYGRTEVAPAETRRTA